MRPILARGLGTALALLLVACSAGGSGSGALPGAAGSLPGATSKRTSAVTFHFKIPRRAHRRGAHYLSPSTASIAVTAFDATHTHQLAQTAENTTPGSGGCTAISDGTFGCSLSIAVPPGDATFDVAAYSQTAEGGTKLSAIVDFAFTVQKGQANQVAMTLGGIPASLDVELVGISAFATGDAVAGFQFGGIGSGAVQRIQLTAKDAEGNVIVDPGAPVLTLTSSSPSKLSIAAVAGSTGLFALTPLAETNALPAPLPATAITLTAKATPVGTGTTALTVTTSVQNDPVTYVGNADQSVQAFAPWSSTPIVTIEISPDPQSPGIAIDSAGNVYVSNYSAGTISEFPPGIETPSRTIAGLLDPLYMVVDGAGDIFVNSDGTDIEEFTPASGASPSRDLSAFTSPTGIHIPRQIALDKAGNLYVVNELASPNGVSIFAPGTTTTPTAVFNAGVDQPTGIALDAAGDVYVLNPAGNNVTEYQPPFSNSTAVAATFGSGATLSSPQALTVDGPGNVYVADGHVYEFTAASPLVAVRTLTSAAATASTPSTDPLNNVYVPWGNGVEVDMYAPGTSTSAFTTLTANIANPYSAVVWP